MKIVIEIEATDLQSTVKEVLSSEKVREEVEKVVISRIPSIVNQYWTLKDSIQFKTGEIIEEMLKERFPVEELKKVILERFTEEKMQEAITEVKEKLGELLW